jgi:hypothetical protein
MILSNPVGQRTTIRLLSAERYAELVQGKHDDDENQIYVVRDAGTHHICAVALGQQRRKMVRAPESARAVAQDIAMPLRRNIQRTMQVVGATMNSNYQMLGGQSRRDQGDWSACDRAIEYRLLANVPSNIGGS